MKYYAIKMKGKGINDSTSPFNFVTQVQTVDDNDPPDYVQICSDKNLVLAEHARISKQFPSNTYVVVEFEA